MEDTNPKTVESCSVPVHHPSSCTNHLTLEPPSEHAVHYKKSAVELYSIDLHCLPFSQLLLAKAGCCIDSAAFFSHLKGWITSQSTCAPARSMTYLSAAPCRSWMLLWPSSICVILKWQKQQQQPHMLPTCVQHGPPFSSSLQKLDAALTSQLLCVVGMIQKQRLTLLQRSLLENVIIGKVRDYWQGTVTAAAALRQLSCMYACTHAMTKIDQDLTFVCMYVAYTIF